MDAENLKKFNQMSVPVLTCSKKAGGPNSVLCYNKNKGISIPGIRTLINSSCIYDFFSFLPPPLCIVNDALN